MSGVQLILLSTIMYLALPRIIIYLKRKIYPPIFNSKIFQSKTQRIGSEFFSIRLDSIGTKKLVDRDKEAFPATFSILNQEQKTIRQENFHEGQEGSIPINQINYWFCLKEVVPNDKKTNSWAVFEIKRLN